MSPTVTANGTTTANGHDSKSDDDKLETLMEQVATLINQQEYQTALNLLNTIPTSQRTTATHSLTNSLRHKLALLTIPSSAPQTTLNTEDLENEVEAKLDDYEQVVDPDDIAPYTARHIITDIINLTAPLEGWVETRAIPIAAIILAVASASTYETFASNAVTTLEKHTPTFSDSLKLALDQIVFVPASTIQFSLALKSNYYLYLKIKRILSSYPWSEVVAGLKAHPWRLAKAIPIVGLSAIPTFGMGLDSFGETLSKTILHAILLYILCSLRSEAAGGINFDFYNQNEAKKEKHEAFSLVTYLLEIREQIKELHKRNGTRLVHKVADSRFIKQFQALSKAPGTDYVNHFVGLTETLLTMFPSYRVEADTFHRIKKLSYFNQFTNALTNWGAEQYNTFWTKETLAAGMGAYTAMSNWRAGAKFPSHLGLPVPNDLLHFFAIFGSTDSDLIRGFLLGSVIIGIPSLYVNWAINTVAMIKLLTRIQEAYTKDPDNENKRPGWRALYHNNDVRIFCTFLLCSCFGASNAGLSATYPFIDLSPVIFINLIINFIVNTATGSMSFDGIFNLFRMAYYFWVSNCFIFDDLYHHYFDTLEGSPLAPENASVVTKSPDTTLTTGADAKEEKDEKTDSTTDTRLTIVPEDTALLTSNNASETPKTCMQKTKIAFRGLFNTENIKQRSMTFLRVDKTIRRYEVISYLKDDLLEPVISSIISNIHELNRPQRKALANYLSTNQRLSPLLFKTKGTLLKPKTDSAEPLTPKTYRESGYASASSSPSVSKKSLQAAEDKKRAAAPKRPLSPVTQGSESTNENENDSSPSPLPTPTGSK